MKSGRKKDNLSSGPYRTPLDNFHDLKSKCIYIFNVIVLTFRAKKSIFW